MRILKKKNNRLFPSKMGRIFAVQPEDIERRKSFKVLFEKRLLDWYVDFLLLLIGREEEPPRQP